MKISSNLIVVMKSSTLFLLFYFDQVSRKNSETAGVAAIRSILKEFFAKSTQKVDLVHFGAKFGVSENLVDKVMRSKDDSISFKVIKWEVGAQQVLKLKISSLLVFDSHESFRKASENLIWASDPKVRHKHLVYFPGARVIDLSNLAFQSTTSTFS